MNVKDIQQALELDVAAGSQGLGRVVAGGYCGDLLSDVMANAPAGALWLTIQTHQNIVAVALLRELAGIILVNGRKPDEETAAKAEAEGIPVLISPSPAFETACRLHRIGVPERKI